MASTSRSSAPSPASSGRSMRCQAPPRFRRSRPRACSTRMRRMTLAAMARKRARSPRPTSSASIRRTQASCTSAVGCRVCPARSFASKPPARPFSSPYSSSKNVSALPGSPRSTARSTFVACSVARGSPTPSEYRSPGSSAALDPHATGTRGRSGSLRELRALGPDPRAQVRDRLAPSFQVGLGHLEPRVDDLAREEGRRRRPWNQVEVPVVVGELEPEADGLSPAARMDDLAVVVEDLADDLFLDPLPHAHGLAPRGQATDRRSEGACVPSGSAERSTGLLVPLANELDPSVAVDPGARGFDQAGNAGVHLRRHRGPEGPEAEQARERALELAPGTGAVAREDVSGRVGDLLQRQVGRVAQV